MDAQPNCAICNSPSYPECPCESERLIIAVRQAEQRAMDERLTEIREWVISHARNHILNDFNARTSNRRAAHSSYLSTLPFYSLYVQYAGHPPLHPAQLASLQSQIHEAQVELKHGIDADWRASVLRYPDVLDYFYSLVELRLPSERSPAVVSPSFSAHSHSDSGKRRSRHKDRQIEMGVATVGERPGGRRRNSHSYAVTGRSKAQPVAPTPPSQMHGGYRHGTPSHYVY